MKTNDSNTEQTPVVADHSPLFNADHRATYCPEDNKLRLYVGRVPRDQYLKLRAEGWVALPKQREAGHGDFAATWTPSRRDTALEYAGIIEDEDAGPEERAADRAERFSGYRDKRTTEATHHADRYDSQPAAHGFQDEKKAERAVARHEKIGDRAGDAWSKAEYWQRRTAGVIGHALYKSTPGVRMGRIKILEADLRRFEQSPSSYPNWIEHTKLRLAYENQMCEAAGGRAALVEMIPGGFIGGMQIVKVNKSAVTGQVVSVAVVTKHQTYRKGNLVEVVGPVLYNVERLKADAYRPPTADELAAFLAARKAEKAARPKVFTPPLINPSEKDAQRLQAVWNEHNAKRKHYFADNGPKTVIHMTQARYSALSKGGEYAYCETVEITGGGLARESGGHMSRPQFPTVGKVRATRGAVIVITDKPQKDFPAEFWTDPRPATLAEVAANMPLLVAAAGCSWLDRMTPEQEAIFNKARMVRIAWADSMTQFGLTEAGMELRKQLEASTAELVNA